jgi:hypothetical protein
MGRATIWRPRDCRQTNWPARGDILAPRRWKPGDPVSAFPPKNEKGSQGWCVRACDSSKSSVAQSLTNVLCNARPSPEPLCGMAFWRSRQHTFSNVGRRAGAVGRRPVSAGDSAQPEGRITALFHALICAIISARITRKTVLSAVVVALALATWIAAFITRSRLMQWRCPRCGSAFASWITVLNTNCSQCGLSIDTQDFQTPSSPFRR